MKIVDVSEVNPNHEDLRGISVSLMRPTSIDLAGHSDNNFEVSHQKSVDEASLKLEDFCTLGNGDYMTVVSDDETSENETFPHSIELEDGIHYEPGTKRTKKPISNIPLRDTKHNKQKKANIQAKKRKLAEISTLFDDQSGMTDSPNYSHFMLDDDDDPMTFSPRNKRYRETIELQ
jgi:hypothetical protein